MVDVISEYHMAMMSINELIMVVQMESIMMVRCKLDQSWW